MPLRLEACAPQVRSWARQARHITKALGSIATLLYVVDRGRRTLYELPFGRGAAHELEELLMGFWKLASISGLFVEVNRKC